MTNQHRVTKLIAFMFVAGCGSKDRARHGPDETEQPHKEVREAKASESSSSGPATAADCAKAKAELARLEACEGGLDEDMRQTQKELDEALVDPRVPSDVKDIIMQGCRHVVATTAGLDCSNIKKKSHRRRHASADE